MFSPVDLSREQAHLESIIKADQSLTLFKQMGGLGQSYAFILAEYIQRQKDFNGGPVLIKAPSERILSLQDERRAFLAPYLSDADFHAYLNPYLSEFMEIQNQINTVPQTEEHLTPLAIESLKVGMQLAIPIVVCPAYVYELFSFAQTASGHGKALLEQYWEMCTHVLTPEEFPFALWMSEGMIPLPK